MTRWFHQYTAIFPNHPVTKELVAIYAVTLEKELTIEQLEAGCEGARANALTFPKPVEIIEAARKSASINEYLGPKMIAYPEISKEERIKALEDPEYKKATALYRRDPQ